MEAILQQAERLGKLLSEHSAAKAYVDARKALGADSQAQRLLRDYESAVRKIVQLERETKPVEVEDKHKLADLQSQVAANELVKRFLQAQVEYLDTLRKAHEAINQQLASIDQ